MSYELLDNKKSVCDLRTDLLAAKCEMASLFLHATHVVVLLKNISTKESERIRARLSDYIKKHYNVFQIDAFSDYIVIWHDNIPVSTTHSKQLNFDL